MGGKLAMVQRTRRRAGAILSRIMAILCGGGASAQSYRDVPGFRSRDGSREFFLAPRRARAGLGDFLFLRHDEEHISAQRPPLYPLACAEPGNCLPRGVVVT